MREITPPQVRAARALLDWPRKELSSKSGVGLRTIVRFEAGEVRPHHSTIEKIRRALEESGIRFLESGDGVEIV
jgi:predicted transcriptional regulator